MKSIDERVVGLMANLPHVRESTFRKQLRLALLEVARDQRHACAEAVLAAHQLNRRGDLMDVDDAHRAVMNAEIEGRVAEEKQNAAPLL